MLLVKTIVKQSDISGFGLFADEYIPKGAIVDKRAPKFDKAFTKGEILSLPPIVQNFLYDYIWKEVIDEENKKYIYFVSMDNTRYINHSFDPNVRFTPESQDSVAVRDIVIGEEITQDYLDFYCDDDDIWEQICKNTGRVYSDFDNMLVEAYGSRSNGVKA